MREAKLVLWLQEDVLQRRHAPKKPRKRKRMATTETAPASQTDNRATAFAEEAKELARDIQAPLEEALAMLIDDRITPLAPGDDEVEPIEGALLQYSTIEVYVAAIMELWQAQTSAGSNRHPNPRTDAVASLISQRRLDRARIARESYEDRGSHGYSGGYTAKELKKMQTILLQDQNRLVGSTPFELTRANPFLLELPNPPRHPRRTSLCPPWPESPPALSCGPFPCRVT